MALTATSGSPTVTVGVTSPKLRATISIELLQASVSAARTTTSVTYELSHATGIWTDPDSNNRMLKDEFPLSDVRFSLVEKNLSETLTFTDVPALGPQKKVSDVFSVYDEKPNHNALNVNLLNSQAMNAQDTAFLVDRGLDKGDALGFSEITAFNHAKVLSDLATFNDDYGVQLEKTLSDSFTLDDSALIDKDYFGNKGNIVGVSDQVTVDYYYGGLVGQRPLNTMSLN